MALPILSCECKTSLFFSSTGLHLCFSGSVKLPGVWLDTAALSLSQRQQHRTRRWHPDSPAALPETKLCCFATCCITHQFCLTETHAIISVKHWEDALNQSDWGIEPMNWMLRASCSTHRAIGANTAHTAVSETLKQAKYLWSVMREANRCVWPFVFLWHYQHQMAEKKLYWKGSWTFVLLPWFCFEVSDAAPAASFAEKPFHHPASIILAFAMTWSRLSDQDTMLSCQKGKDRRGITARGK